MPTIPALFLQRCDRSPDTVAFFIPEAKDLFHQGQPVPEHPRWRGITLGAARAEVSGLARRLYALGVDRGVPVAILAETSHLWAAADQAILALGGITVGIYPNLLPEQAAYILRHSEARVLLIEDAARYTALQPHLDDLPDLVHVFSQQDTGGLIPQMTPAQPDEPFLRKRVAMVELDDVCTYVYTSGTTGDPKGAILTHRNFDSIITASRTAIPLQKGDRSILFLPLAHSLQRFALYRGLTEDVTGYYATIEDLPEVLRVARPQVLATVPRMLEKIKATAEAKAAEKSPKAAEILAWAIQVGKAVNHHTRKGERVPLTLRTQHKLAEKLVYHKVKERFGGEIRTLVSGGAALSVEVAEWFEALGIQVREGWGLTETSAPATANRVDRFKIGTVGLPLPGVVVKLDTDGELLIKSPGNFQGYLKDPEATAAAFTPDGFFRSGDLGSIDSEGFVRILDRKKELIVTAGGKNIAAVPIEKLLEGGLIGQAVIVGSERPYLVALLALEPDAAAAFARQRGLPTEPQALAARPELRAAVEAIVAAANSKLPRFESVKRWALLPGPLTVEAGEITPTLKLKRRVIAERHAALIQGLYDGA